MAEDKDLQLLEQADLKFGLANDEQFPKLTAALLPPLLEKLGSTHASVRSKVLKVLSQVNQRYKAELKWKLPTSALLALLTTLSPKDALTSNFTVGYLLSALAREDAEVQKTTMLGVMEKIETLNEPCQLHVLSAFVHLIDTIRTKGSKETREGLFNFLKKEAARKLFMNYVHDLLLFVPPAGALLVSPGHSLDTQKLLKMTPLSAIQAQLPDASAVVPQVGSYTLAQLTEHKTKLVLFLKENIDILGDSALYVAAIISSSDTLNDVQRNGDDLLRRLSKDPLSDRPTVTKLFQLFLGEATGTNGANPEAPAVNLAQQNAIQQQNGEETSPWKSKRSPASFAARSKILEVLCRSPIAATLFPFAIQLLFASLFGEVNQTHVKLQQTALGFCQNIIRESSAAHLKVFSPLILSGLSKYMAWLKEVEHTGTNANITPHIEMLRIATLHALSALGKRAPSLFSSSITLIEELMEDLRKTRSVVLVSALQEALTSLCPALTLVSQPVLLRLKSLLLSNFEDPTATTDTSSSVIATENAMQVDEPPPQVVAASAGASPTTSSKYVAQFYANRIFPYSDEFSRYLNILGVNDTNKQVVEEAKRGLEPFKVVDNEIVSLIRKTGSAVDMDKDVAESHPEKDVPWPSFSAMVTLAMSKRSPAHAQGLLSFPAPTFQALLIFLQDLLKFHRAQHASAPTSQKLLHSPHFAAFATLLLEALTTTGNAPLSHIAAEILLEALQFAPLSGLDAQVDAETLSSSFLASVDRSAAAPSIETVLLDGNLKYDTLKLVSRILAIVTPSEMRAASLSRLFASVTNRSNLKREQQVGAMHGLSSIIATSLRMGQTVDKLEEMVSALQITLELAVKDKTMHHGLSNPLLLASIESIGTISKWHANIASITAEKTVLQSVLALLDHPDVNIVIAAAYCASYMALGDRSLSNSEELRKALLATFRVKSEETHFSIGEALSNVTYGWNSPVACDPLMLSFEKAEQEKRATTSPDEDQKSMNAVLTIVLQDYFLSARPDTRMASAIWLLTLLKNCGAHSEIRKQLKAIQTGFTQLLSDPNEILQEVAGKALSLVYELGDETTQKELVNALVNALQKGASSFKMTADSELFVPGEMTNAPTGDKITTYSELVQLSTELGQPDMVYKFMQLSSHNALWNSKKGAAFATGELAERAKSQLAPHIPQLVPKLYRASFDPNQKIASAMHSLLTSLLGHNFKTTVVKHISAVLRDLLNYLVDAQWRTREACCNALADILPSRDYEEVSANLQELWERCFRVLDDIKESVRKSAEAFNKALSNLTLRLCDPSYTNRDHGREALNIALPHLLAKGLVSPVKEVRAISIDMLQKLSKVSSFLLKPHIATLIPVLLKSLATLDSAQLNYWEQHASSIGVSGEVFDEARVRLSKSSPVHATIDYCVQQVDTQNIGELSPQLATLLSADNHVSTRAGAAGVITQLALTRPEALRTVAHKLMLALKRGISARSQHVRRTYGYAMGQLARCAKKKTLETVVSQLLDSYKNATPEDSDTRSAVAEALLELSKASIIPIDDVKETPTTPDAAAKSSNAMAVDASPHSAVLVDPVPSSSSTGNGPKTTIGKAAEPVLKPFLPSVVPVVFLARFDANEDTSKVFGKIWEECGASLALYVPETVEALSVALNAASWQMKQQGAKAIAKFSETLNISQFAQQAPQLLQMLLTGLKGRTWTGKESLLDALAKLVACCGEMWANPSLVPSNKTSPDEILKVMLTEVARKSLEYRKAAILSISDVLKAFGKYIPTYNAFHKVYESLVEQATTIHTGGDEGAEKEANESERNTDKKEEESATSRSIRMLAIQALCMGFPGEQLTQPQKDALPVILEVVARTFRTTNQYTVKVSLLNSLKLVFPKITTNEWESVVPLDLLQQRLLNDLFLPALADPKYSVVRSAACAALIELLVQAMDSPSLEKVISSLEHAVNEADKLGNAPVSNARLLGLLSRAKNV